MAEATLINVTINGISQPLPVTTLSKALQHYSEYQQYAAVAVNQQFIPKSAYDSTHLKQGDCIEILIPMQGG